MKELLPKELAHVTLSQLPHRPKRRDHFQKHPGIPTQPSDDAQVLMAQLALHDWRKADPKSYAEWELRTRLPYDTTETLMRDAIHQISELQQTTDPHTGMPYIANNEELLERAQKILRRG